MSVRAWSLAVLAACGGGKSALPDGAPGDAPPGGSYSALFLLGGLDRVFLIETTPTTCFGIVLRNPGSGNGEGITIPVAWDFEAAFARQPAAACDPRFSGPIANMFDATAQSGTIAWASDPPQTITSAQVTLTFANAPAWCPPRRSLAVSNLPVQQ